MVAVAAVISILGPILAKAGAPILKSALENEVGGAAGRVGSVVVDAISTALGVAPTPEAIQEAHVKDPAKVETIIREVEASPEAVEYLAAAIKSRDDMLTREDTKGFFAWGWRPAMSWLVIFLFGWAMVIVPVVNGALHAGIAIPATEDILQLAGLWLVIYGGGHTAKEIWGKK